MYLLIQRLTEISHFQQSIQLLLLNEVFKNFIDFFIKQYLRDIFSKRRFWQFFKVLKKLSIFSCLNPFHMRLKWVWKCVLNGFHMRFKLVWKCVSYAFKMCLKPFRLKRGLFIEFKLFKNKWNFFCNLLWHFEISFYLYRYLFLTNDSKLKKKFKNYNWK